MTNYMTRYWEGRVTAIAAIGLGDVKRERDFTTYQEVHFRTIGWTVETAYELMAVEAELGIFPVRAVITPEPAPEPAPLVLADEWETFDDDEDMPWDDNDWEDAWIVAAYRSNRYESHSDMAADLEMARERRFY